MKIKFLGTRGEVEDKSARHTKQSGILITSGDFKLLVDCGEVSHLDSKPDAIIVTHAHIDHIKGLKDSAIEPKLVESDQSQTLGPFSVTMFPVEHSVLSPSHGYRIEAEGKVIIVTGDVLSIPDHRILEGADIYIGDGSSLERDIERVQKESGEKYGHACYDESTLIFTKRGLKPFRELRKDEEVLSIDLSKPRQEVRWNRVRDVLVYDYDDELIRFKSKRIDLLVTPNHRMLTSYFGGPIFKTADELSILSRPMFYISGNWRKRWTNKMIPWYRLAGWYVAEGTYGTDRNRIRFCVNSRDLVRLLPILNQLRLPHYESYQSNEIIVHVPDKTGKLKDFVSQFGRTSAEKCLPRKLLDSSQPILEAFLIEYLYGDGQFSKINSRSKFDSQSATTISPKLRDGLIELAVKLGYQPKVSLKKNTASGLPRIKSVHQAYAISFVRRRRIGFRRDQNTVQREKYKGKVWCLELARDHNFLVYRNGKVCFCGNSIKKQTGWAEEAGIKNIMFTHFGKVPIGMHERTLRKAMQGFAKEAKVMIGFDGFEFVELLEGVRPAFGSPGGKRFLAKKIVGYIPDHKTYVEPFAGGAAVFFAKKPSEIEVLNDKDSEIAFAFRHIKAGKFGGLRKFKMDANREYFEKLMQSKPSNESERFHRFLYLHNFSYGNAMSHFAPSIEATGRTLDIKIGYLPRVSERLRGVSIRDVDFRKILIEEDSPGTFFYLDPPYPEQQEKLKTDLVNKDIMESVRKLKSKWILSLPDTTEVREMFGGYEIKKVQVFRTFSKDIEGNKHYDNELLISNFPLKATTTWLAEAEEISATELRENLRGGKETFDPTGWDADSAGSYLNAFDEIVTQSYYLTDLEAHLIFDVDVRKRFIIRPKQSLALENFNALRSDKKEYGFVRFSSPKEIASGKFEYPVRDFIPWPVPKTIDVAVGTSGFGKRENLKEAIFVAKQFTPEELKKLTDQELLQRHELIHQIFMERGARKDDELIINANRFVQEEFGRRKMGMPLTPDNLDQYTLQLFKSVVMENLQEGLFDEWMVECAKKMAEVGPIVVVPKFISWTGSTAFVKDRLPDDADVIVRGDSISDGLAVLLNRLWQKFAETSPCLHSSPEGPNWRFLATHDLVLVPRKEFQFEEVQGEGFRQAFYESASFVEPELDEHDSGDPLIEGLQERVLDAKKMPLYSAVLQNHWRRKSSHFDFRVKMNDHLEGFTIAALPEGVVKEDVDTITRAKEMQGKIDWKWAPDMDPKKHVLAFKKPKQPLVWLGIEDEVIEPGDVGATTEGKGVILRIARGMAYPGVDKKHFKEFFLNMGPYKGRTVFVLQPIAKEKGAKKETVWQAWTNLEEQTPYLLSRRGRMLKDYTPPEGESRISPEWEKKIKSELRWWDKGVQPAERLKRLDLAYNDLIERDILKGRLIKVKGE